MSGELDGNGNNKTSNTPGKINMEHNHGGLEW